MEAEREYSVYKPEYPGFDGENTNHIKDTRQPSVSQSVHAPFVKHFPSALQNMPWPGLHWPLPALIHFWSSIHNARFASGFAAAAARRSFAPRRREFCVASPDS